ncbi:MAG: hypothetical protein RIS88_2299 [Pseudomonadota bacterium]|jgi:choline dehydrogenase-like flavoprotein
MIEDANAVPRHTVLRADVCVVGAGPAGIALALALGEHGLQVLLLEAGHEPHDAAAQALYAGEVANAHHSPPHRYRLRGLGGSSAIWGGRCMPLDPIDFEARSWVPYSGWPLDYEALRPYYVAANALAEAGRYAYDAQEALPGAPPLVRGWHSETVRTQGLERFSCPTDFGRRYARRLRLSPAIRVLRGAVCTGIRLAPDTPADRPVPVRALDIATLAGNRLQAQARAVVLAAGGLETARLLLSSDDVQPRGVGNHHDVVGRYYMCHLAGNLGTLTLHGPPAAVRHGYEVAPDGVYCRRRLAVFEACQRQERLLNAVARLHFPRIADPAHRSGVLSGLFLARGFIRYEYGRRLHDGRALSVSLLARHAFNVVRDAGSTAAFLAHWLARRTLALRKFPSVILANTTNRFSLEVQGEQRPHPDSRVTLAASRDALGLRRLRIDWRYQPEDIASLRRTLDLIASEVQRNGVGHLHIDHASLEDDLLRYGAYGGHHIGTARMGRDPRTSVVDAHARVHDVDNLYIAGSAVFPTSGQANPTLTLLALSLRLADHLAQRLRPQARPLSTTAGAIQP